MFSVLTSSPLSAHKTTAPFSSLILNSSTTSGTQIQYYPEVVEDNIETILIDSNAIAVTNDETSTSTTRPKVFFTAQDNTSNITNIIINSQSYSLAVDLDSIQPGEFSFDFDSKEVVINLKADKIHSLIVKSSVDSVAVKSTCINKAIEPLLSYWNAIAISSLGFNFEQEPEGFSFDFIDCKARQSFIKQQLDNGSVHNCFGYRWVVDSLSIKELADLNRISVTVNLIYFLADRNDPSLSPLDKPIALKKKIGSSYKKTRTIGEFAKRAGVAYRGEDFKIRISRNTASTEYTTVRELVEDRAITANGFVHYGKQGIEVRKWTAAKTHVINTSDLRNKPTFNYLGHGSWLNGVRLAQEYRNRKINLDFDVDSQSDVEGITQNWIFENCNDLFELYNPVQADINGNLRSPSADILRSPGINFDSGGNFGKTGTLVTRVNGTTTFEEKIKTNYAFSSDEIYQVEVTEQGNLIISLDSTANPINHFKVVHQSITDWVFDADGYLTNIRTRGTEIARLQQETEKLEAATALARAKQNAEDGVDDPYFLAIAAEYQFSENLPITDDTTYSLQKHRDFYDDVIQPDSCEDDGFIEPKWVQVMRRTREDFFVKPNPKSTEDFIYPPIQTGRYFREIERTIPTSTKDNQKYEVRYSKHANEGEYFKNGRAEKNTEYLEDKPPTQTRLNLEFDYQDSKTNKNYDLYHDGNYYLYSSGVIGEEDKFTENSIGYSDIDDPNEVKAIAQTQLSINNTRNSLTTVIDIHWRNNVEVGDFVLFRGKKWKIFSINDVRSIQKGFFNSDRFELTLGYYLQPKLVLENRKGCINSFLSAIAPF